MKGSGARRRRPVVLMAVMFILGLAGACGGRADSSKPDPARCSTEETFAPKCDCYGAGPGQVCAMDCHGAASCDMLCEDFATSCSAACGDRCNVRCLDGPTCDAQCGAECIVSCRAGQACTGSCGSLCNYTCNGARECTVTVGDASQVSCMSSATCNVTCTGTCVVRCDRALASCTATCPEGVERKECAEGWACGVDC